MAVKLKPVTWSPSFGAKWWQFPDFFWRKRQDERERRLRLTLQRQVLPLLQRLENIYSEENAQFTPRLQGRNLAQIEKDVVAVETALYLFELAMAEGLFQIEQKKERTIPLRRGMSVPVGSCGLSLEDVLKRYVKRVAYPILKNAGHDPDDLAFFLSAQAQTDVRMMARLKLLARFPRELISELRLALKGSLDPLFIMNEQYLQVLEKCDAERFIRPLRMVMRDGFRQLFNWHPQMLRAAALALDHEEKVRALGEDILNINNPATLKAIGSWPVSEASPDDYGSTVTTKIDEVRAQLGRERFTRLLSGAPELVAQVGSWDAETLDRYRDFLGVLTAPILKAIQPLSAEMQIIILEGYREKVGYQLMVDSFKKPIGLQVVMGIIAEVNRMMQSSPQSAQKISGLITGSYFNDYFASIKAE